MSSGVFEGLFTTPVSGLDLFSVGLLGLRQIWKSDLFSVGQKVHLCGENSRRRIRRDKLGLVFERRRQGERKKA
jgi:hypothetical protein